MPAKTVAVRSPSCMRRSNAKLAFPSSWGMGQASTIAVRGGRTRRMWARSSTQDRDKPTAPSLFSVEISAHVIKALRPIGLE